MRTAEEAALRGIAPELTVHGVTTVVVEQTARTNAEGKEYEVMNMGIVDKDGNKLAHLTLFSREGAIEVIKVGEDTE